jgi:hypothetical protein
MLCTDDIFSLYVHHCAKFVNSTFLSQILMYTLSYRQCLN